MKQLEFEEKDFQEGITLIALIITIIVLLILAGVSIATLTGDNGILIRANEAKMETEEAKEDELRRLTASEAATNIENTKHTDNSTGEEKTVTIPAGFAVSQVEGENTIADGLVIIDSKGNEFVWVPVSQKNFATEFVRKNGYYNNNPQTSPEFSNLGEANADGINEKLIESSITQKESQEMYASIEKNEGFYIGRYEAGKDNNGNTVVKEGVNVYNNVTWSRNGQMNEESTEIAEGVDGTKDGAIELSRDFDTENNYTTVTSTLCYGVQWDRTLSWIDPEYDDFAKDSTGRGNYNEDENTNSWKGNASLTGASEDYKIRNIYDLTGNMREWTMESNNIGGRINRGGNFYNTGYEVPASYRSSYSPDEKFSSIGFRITLYLNV